jgi:response regulator RpfG family c-di-GMP phosphodiesterase
MLIVDDEPAVRDVMSRWATSLGLKAHTAGSADEALATLQAHHCDVAVIDVLMPGHDGLWLAGELQREHPSTAVVIATGHAELVANPSRPFIADLLIKPVHRERFLVAVDRGREWHRQAVKDLARHARFAREIDLRVAEVCDDVARLRTQGGDEMAALLDLARDRGLDMTEHGERVARLSAATARRLGLTDADILQVDRAARLHDIGKVAMPDALVAKPSALAPGELGLMRRHVDAGASILAATATLADLAPIVGSSHEWFNGDGYTRGLAGDAIPFASRIIGVADAYDAMICDRPYRRRRDPAQAAAEILRCTPDQFDPDVAVAFLALIGH